MAMNGCGETVELCNREWLEMMGIGLWKENSMSIFVAAWVGTFCGPVSWDDCCDVVGLPNSAWLSMMGIRL